MTPAVGVVSGEGRGDGGADGAALVAVWWSPVMWVVWWIGIDVELILLQEYTWRRYMVKRMWW